jgi:hypothetical protein
MEMELIGHVGVDSGQLLLCDPCYIDSEWSKEEFTDIRIYEHKDTKERLQYRVDFPHYEAEITKYGKNMNELLKTGEWLDVPATDSEFPFSYNACCKATLSNNGHGQLNYNAGHPGVGVAFTTQISDGYYPVYAIYNDNGDLLKVEVLFQSDDDDDEN